MNLIYVGMVIMLTPYVQNHPGKIRVVAPKGKTCPPKKTKTNVGVQVPEHETTSGASLSEVPILKPAGKDPSVTKPAEVATPRLHDCLYKALKTISDFPTRYMWEGIGIPATSP